MDPKQNAITALTTDHALAALAGRQRGVVSRDQLRDLNLTDAEIRGRMARGTLHQVTDCVFAVGHVGLSRRARANAAFLQLGVDRAAVSHMSAARAWDIAPAGVTGEVHISVLDRRSVAMPDGIRLHRPRSLDPREIVWRHHLPVTTPERTLRDLLPTSSEAELTRMLEQTVTRVGRSPDALHAWARDLPSVPGRLRLARALDHIVGPTIIRSELEAIFRTLCQETGLPLPETNVRVNRWELDVLWRDVRLVVELDSYRYHAGRWQFDRDHRKALDLVAQGYEVIRLTWPQVKHEHRFVGDTLRAVLIRRGALL